MAKYLVDSSDIEIEEVSGTENIRFNFASGNTLETKINNLSNYSTTEQVIGEWITGKPLYRKVIDFGNLPDTTYKDVSTGLDDAVITLRKLEGIVVFTNNYSLCIPNVSDVPGEMIKIVYRTGDIRITTTSDRSLGYAYVFIEYTKNTD